MQNDLKANSFYGLAITLIVGFLWLTTFVSVVNLPSESSYWVVGFALLLLRVFAYTGLFIIAHDSMHQSLAPSFPELNHQIGRGALALYAGLLFDVCELNHISHHNNPESEHDPDYCVKTPDNPVSWYCGFMLNYLSASQILRLSLVFLVCYATLLVFSEDALFKLIIFCVIPLFLSSIQLFLFGTWLPHRKSKSRSADETPRSLALHPLISLAACYHFGYHKEHHSFPHIPWFRLPLLRQQCLKSTAVRDSCN